MKVGFIGAGNMASAIVRGVVASGSVAAEDIVVTSAHGHSARALAREAGVDVLETNEELVEQVGAGGVVVLAVKPHVIPEVLAPLRDLLAEYGSLVVSLAAGTPLATLEGMLPEGQAVVRVMPNVNSQIRAGMAAVCGNAEATDEEVDAVVGLFEAVGAAIVLPERDFAAFSAVAGAAPAFVFTFIDALARGGLKNGLPKAKAVRIAAQTVLGSARMVLERAADGVTPADLVDTVTSPGGTTIAGVVAMEEAGFTPAVVRGVQATIDRDRALAEG
ncbi:pyrroline-5-carboxylate reductase [Georgenia sp. AZ-5]|uniref:pyrroline-5-carboxylate reductase n=1 Tax=Georgenia sp. AZ-5 TaxID=3367526 RepID=UPI003754E63D